MLYYRVPEVIPVSFEGRVIEILKEPTTMETKALKDVWEEACKGADGEDYAIPLKDHMQIGQLKPVLPNVFLLDVVENGRDIRIRLAGTGVVNLLGRDVTGVLLSSLPEARWRMDMYRPVIESGRPFYCRSNLGSRLAPKATIENAVMPICDKFGVFNMLFCTFGYISIPNV